MLFFEPSLVYRRQRLFKPLLAFERPDFFPVVKLSESRPVLGELQPWHLRFCVDVNIRSNGVRVIQSADTDKPDLMAMTVVAPQRDLAFWAAIDVMRSKSARHRNGS